MNDLVDTRTLATGLATLSSAIRTTSGEIGESYLKLDKSGHWKYGVDAIEPEEDSQWAVDPSRVAAGWIAWADGKVAGEIMRTAPEAAAEGPLTRSDCPDVGVDWSPQMSLAMLCTGGPDEGARVLYSASSISGLRAIRGIEQLIAHRGDQRFGARGGVFHRRISIEELYAAADVECCRGHVRDLEHADRRRSRDVDLSDEIV